jgi:hypothetical protein
VEWELNTGSFKDPFWPLGGAGGVRGGKAPRMDDPVVGSIVEDKTF